MSGRGRNNNHNNPPRGRSGRGRGRSSSKKGNGRRDRTKSNQTKAKELKYNPHTYGNTQYAPEPTVTEAVFQRVQKDFRQGYNVVKSLREGKRMDFKAIEPTLEIAKAVYPPQADATDAATKARVEEVRKHQQEANNLKFQTNYKVHKGENKNLTIL